MRSNGKRITVVYLCWCFFILFLQGPAFSEDIKIEAEGKASLSGGDQASARGKALEDFEKQVVTKAIVELLGEDQYERNKNTIEKNILHKPDRYIKAYKVMGEETGEGFYKVRGEATIDSTSLKKVLSSLRLSPITPKPHKTTEESLESAVSKKEEQSTPEEKNLAQSENGEGMKTTQNLFWTYDRSCDLEIGDKNAGDLFAEILMARLSELGFTVASTDNIQEETPKNAVLKGNFICFENKIDFQMEIINNSQRKHLEDYVPLDENTPLMDALMTLAEISSNHILLILGLTEEANSPGLDETSGQKNRPETGHGLELTSQEKSKTPSSDNQGEDRGGASSSQALWQIVIRDPHGGLHWERLQKRLKESGRSIDVSRILISSESFTVETPELDDKTINLLESLLSKDGLRIDLDHQSRRVLIRSQGGQ